MNITEFLGKDIAFTDDLWITPSGDFDVIAGLDNVKETLFRRLITQPGTLIHRPGYGVGIKDFQGSINSLSNQRILAQRIKEQFEQDPRVESVDGVGVKVGDSTPDRIEINVRTSIVGYGEKIMSFVPFGDT